MYSSTPGMGGGAVATAAGIAALPNTNGNTVLLIASLLTILVGAVILTSSVVRVAVKKANRL